MNSKGKYQDLVKSLEIEYFTIWKETIFDLNKISVLASWKPAFSLIINSWIGGYQKFLIAVSAARTLQTSESICENI